MDGSKLAEKRLFPRFAKPRVREALGDTPIVILTGPRQAGKTTLARSLSGLDRTYLTFDDEEVLAGARADPVGFVGRLDKAIIDEVQRAPEIFRSIKASVDRERRSGRFLLTGSADIMTVPALSEALTGRMETIPLHPLSRAEILRRRPRFLDAVFAGEVPHPVERLTGDSLVEAVLTGGFPEVVSRQGPHRRQRWCLAYADAIVQRDVRSVAEVQKLRELADLLRVLASYSARLPNFTEIGSRLGLDYRTLLRYVGVLERLFVVIRLPPWFRNEVARLGKTPKLHFLDSGLAGALRGLTARRLRENRVEFGPLLETFVVDEIVRQSSWAPERLLLYHYRDKDLDEVDVVIENLAGDIVGIEVKSTASVTAADFRGLRKLARACGGAFRAGVVLYDGRHALPFGDKLHAAPVAALWS